MSTNPSGRRLSASVFAAVIATFACACAARQHISGTDNAMLNTQDIKSNIQLIDRPPRDVLPAALRALAKGGPFDLEAVQRELAGASESLVDGQAVSTLVQTETIDCLNRSDLVPSRVWAIVCAKGGTLERFHFSGDAGVARGEAAKLYALAPDDARRFALAADEAQGQAESLKMILQDVTQPFQMEWPGHFPFAEYAFAYGRPDNLLMILKTDQESQSRVTSITIYNRR